MLFDWLSLPRAVQALDAFLVVFFFLYITGSCLAWRARNRTEIENHERNLAAASVGTFITVSVAGAAILLTGTGVVLGLKPGDNAVPQDVFTQLVLATVWLVWSLFCGVVAASYVLNHIHRKQSVAEEPLVMTFATAQLTALWIGGVMLVIGLFLF